MRSKKEVNVWRTVIYISVTIFIIISFMYFYNTNTINQEETEEDVMLHNYSYLLSNKELYITPDSVSNFTIDVLNCTKDLNISDYITIFRYLRDNFDRSILVDQPRPPVETISRGLGSDLDLSLLYTSMLLYLDYDAYLFISDELITAIFIQDAILYVFDWKYHSPLEIDNPRILLDYELYNNVIVMSPSYTRVHNGDFYLWVRRNI